MEVEHSFSLNFDWFQDLAKTINCKPKGNKLIILSDEFGKGHFYFTDIMPGMSVFLMDALYNNPIKLKRGISKDDLYILHFDLSEDMNLITVGNITRKTGYQLNLGLAVIDSKTKSCFEPTIGSKVYGLRILVEKKLLYSLMKSNRKNDVLHPKVKGKRTLHFYDYIDSNSIILMNELKNKTEYDDSFDLFIKGVALKLFANFLEKYSHSTPLAHRVTEYEINLMNKTKDYLLDNLYNSFPGVPFLAEMAGMSVSKYKILFKKLYLSTPNDFFIREKTILGNKLLTSGTFSSLTQIIYELNYTKLSHFNTKYFKIFKKMPSDDFIKNPEIIIA